MALFHTTVLDNQIKALPTVDTASGSIATFDTDLTENLVEVKCQIVAKQASGTPSPVNPLPITTFSEMNVSHSGKNLLSFSTMTITSLTTIINNFFLKAGDYTFSIDVNNTTNIAGSFTIRIGTTAIASTAFVGYYQGRVNRSFTLSQDSTINIILGGASAGYSFSISNAQIEIGTPASDFVVYTGNLYTVAFGQTVANGVLDITTGKLRVTHGVVDLGALTWTKDTTTLSVVVFRAPIENRAVGDLYGKCEIYLTSNDTRNFLITHDLAMTRWNATGTNVAVRDDSLSSGTATDFTTAVSGAHLVYELATPIEIQLDSITLQALLNENNIWCDTGDTEVKFLLSVGKAIS